MCVDLIQFLSEQAEKASLVSAPSRHDDQSGCMRISSKILSSLSRILAIMPSYNRHQTGGCFLSELQQLLFASELACALFVSNFSLLKFAFAARIKTGWKRKWIKLLFLAIFWLRTRSAAAAEESFFNVHTWRLSKASNGSLAELDAKLSCISD